MGTSCLHLVCTSEQYGLLCPSEDAREFVPMQSPAGADDYTQADESVDEVFRMPHKPGAEAPPVSSLVLLVITEYCWVTFGRKLLLCELALYCAFLALLTFATVDRSDSLPYIKNKTCGHKQAQPNPTSHPADLDAGHGTRGLASASVHPTDKILSAFCCDCGGRPL